jgi:hypothetical protein
MVKFLVPDEARLRHRRFGRLMLLASANRGRQHDLAGGVGRANAMSNDTVIMPPTGGYVFTRDGNDHVTTTGGTSLVIPGIGTTTVTGAAGTRPSILPH